MPFLSLYDILEIKKDCNSQQIKEAYRKLAKIYHPDKKTGDESVFLTVNNAYEILSNPGKKEEYDYYLKNFQSANKNKPNDSSNLISSSLSSSWNAQKILSNINYLLWDIEIFLAGEYKNHFDKKFKNGSVKDIILEMLTFYDKWVLLPAGFCDYFMQARKLDSLNISDYKNTIENKNNSLPHKPFFSITNYFYDIRKRSDKFLNTIKQSDLFQPLEGTNLRLIESIIESQNLIRYYLTSLNKIISGDEEEIKPYILNKYYEI